MKIIVRKIYLVRDLQSGDVLAWNTTKSGAVQEITDLEKWSIKNNCFTPNSLEIREIDITGMGGSDTEVTIEDLEEAIVNIDLLEYFEDCLKKQLEIEEFEKDFPF